MPLTVDGHSRRLLILCGAMLAGLVAYGVVVTLVPLPADPTLPQGEPLLWGFAFLAAVNLVTIMPAYRAMLAAPRRVYTLDHRPQPLMNAHLTAHVVAFARLEAVGVLGLVLYFLTGRRDWFWVFTGVSGVGMLLLWPSRAKIRDLVAIGQAAPAEGAQPR